MAKGQAQEGTRSAVFDIIGRARLFVGISLVLVAASVVLLAVRGLNLGIDFTGGTLLDRSFERPATVAEIRAVLTSRDLAGLGLGRAGIQVSEGGHQAIIRVPELTSEQIQLVDAALASRFGAVTDLRTEVIGPVIGKELLRATLLALLIGLGGILLYVSLRFEYRFATAGILALVHDALVTLGVFALVQREVNTPFVAAMLTVIGYSINDTIVVFDRIREMLRLHVRQTPAEVANEAILQTLNRSINTSLTTLLAVVALYFLGGTTIKDFSLALLIGVITGTYSSIFIASPIWVWWRQLGRRRAATTGAK